MTDLDHLLADLGSRPLDPRLGAIDASVFAGLKAAQQPVLSRGALGVLTGLALLGGMLATAWPAPAALAGDATPIGVPRELMPSTLLGEAP